MQNDQPQQHPHSTTILAFLVLGGLLQTAALAMAIVWVASIYSTGFLELTAVGWVGFIGYFFHEFVLIFGFVCRFKFNDSAALWARFGGVCLVVACYRIGFMVHLGLSILFSPFYLAWFVVSSLAILFLFLAGFWSFSIRSWLNAAGAGAPLIGGTTSSIQTTSYVQQQPEYQAQVVYTQTGYPAQQQYGAQPGYPIQQQQGYPAQQGYVAVQPGYITTQ